MVEETLQIEDELKSLNRRMERVEKKIDLIDSDRQILEDILGRMTQILEVWKITRQHDNTVRKDIKEEINLVGDKIEASVETKIEEMGSSFKSRKKSKKGWFKKLIERR